MKPLLGVPTRKALFHPDAVEAGAEAIFDHARGHEAELLVEGSHLLAGVEPQPRRAGGSSLEAVEGQRASQALVLPIAADHAPTQRAHGRVVRLRSDSAAREELPLVVLHDEIGPRQPSQERVQLGLFGGNEMLGDVAAEQSQARGAVRRSVGANRATALALEQHSQA